MAENQPLAARFGNLGAIIAVVVLIIAIVLVLINKMDPLEAGLFAALAVARLT